MSEASKACAVPWEAPGDRGRELELALGALDLLDGLTERDAGREVEGDRHRRQLAEMRDGEWADGRREPRHRVERHELARLRAHVQQGELVGVALVRGVELQDDPVLVRRRVDRGHLARAVGAVERALDLLGAHAKGRGLVAVDVDGDLRAHDL